MLHQKIQDEIKTALKEKDEIRLITLRGLLAAFINELVTQKRKPSEILEDELALSVIFREAKKRKDSIEQFEKGGRKDLADNEKKELVILESFLPKQMSKEEIQKIVLEKKRELNITDKSQMGLFMGAVMKELKGKADGTEVKNVIEQSFN